jgi:glutaredoxin-like protein NrdH
LEDAGQEYTVVDVTTSFAALEYVQDLGYSQAPIIVVEEQHHWAGFRPDLIKTLSKSTQNQIAL